MVELLDDEMNCDVLFEYVEKEPKVDSSFLKDDYLKQSSISASFL